VDGAHATGQIAVDIGALAAAGVRGYVGDGHKWLFSGKGSAVLWLHPELQDVVIPPVISSEGKGTGPGECSIKNPWSPWMDQFSYVGARDYAAYATMGDAIDFREWVCAAQTKSPPTTSSLPTTDCVIEQINAQRLWATEYLVKRWGTVALLPAELTPAMAQVRLPLPGPGKNASVYGSVHPRLLAEEGIEVVMRQGYDAADPAAWWTRLSCQIYLGRQDIMRLGDAVLRIVVGTDRPAHAASTGFKNDEA
jgi:selenocysteine lyase/cysteine desulfurase